MGMALRSEICWIAGHADQMTYATKAVLLTELELIWLLPGEVYPPCSLGLLMLGP